MSKSLTIASLLLLTACAPPRYSYFFPQPPAIRDQGHVVTLTPLTPPPNASALHAGSVVGPEAPLARVAPVVVPPARMEDERVKVEIAQRPPAQSIKEDPGLRRSIIFAAGGLVGLLIGGNVFWVVGSLSLMIGMIFFIKWLLRK